MIKKLFLLTIVLQSLISTAQITVNVPTAGTFSSALSAAGADADTVTNLVVTGNIDIRDVQFMRDNMPVLSILNLEAVQIQEYITYPANEMPENSFHHPSTSISKLSLTSIILPNSINSIGNEAFTGCSGLSGNLMIPVSVTKIGFMAFDSCSGFTGSLTIPNSVTSISSQAFNDCSGLTDTLVIPASVLSIGNYVFSGCGKITHIKVDTNNSKFSDIDGVLFNKNKTYLIQFPASKVADSYTIPNTVTGIGESAFLYCDSLTGSLSIPDSVVYIGSYAFYGCKGLTGSLLIPNSVVNIGYGAFHGCRGFTGDLVIPNSVTSVWDGAFSFCYNLKGTLKLSNSLTSIKRGVFQYSNFTGDITIPNSVRTIEEYAFENSDGFTGTLTIPSSVNSIGEGAFYSCSGLQKIIVVISVPLTIEQYTFYNVNKTSCELVVPIGSKAAYQKALYWKDFKNITEAIFVTYNTQGGTSISDTIVDYNTVLLKPDNPIKKSYAFNGWYKETNYQNAWNFNTDLVTTNTTLYAKWVDKFVVKFNTLGGNIIADDSIKIYSTMTAPEDPTKTGYAFAGWHKEADCINAWNFTDDVVTADITLYAKWIINTYTVSFNSQGGSAVSDIVADYNTIISAPADPAKTDYIFAGWCKDAECTHAWNFATDVVTTDTILYAKWTSNGTNPPNSIETKNNTNPSLFPSPATDFVKIEGEKLKSITIYNLLGEAQLQLFPEDEESISFNVSNLNPGLYFVLVKTSDSKVNILKMIKN